MDKYDRRHSPRKKKEATIQVLLASDEAKGRRQRNDLILVKIHNQCDEGFYFEIDRALMPGSNVRVKMISPQGYRPEEAHYMCDGRVIWCEKADDAATRFGVGIKILRKVLQARVLTSRFKQTGMSSMN